MSIQPASAEPESAADYAVADSLYYRSVLHELIEIGAGFARQVQQQAQAETVAPECGADAAVAPDLTAQFDRVARTIRRTIILARAVAEPLPVRAGTGDARRRAAIRASTARAVPGANAGDVEAAEGSEVGSLRCEVGDRMERPEMGDAVDHRPVDQIIAEIRRDLGLAPMVPTPRDSVAPGGAAASLSPDAVSVEPAAEGQAAPDSTERLWRP
jgi:hypothetical protein